VATYFNRYHDFNIGALEPESCMSNC